MTSVTLPAPVTGGMLVIENGPGRTGCCATSALLTKTSTVDGTVACPATTSPGERTRLGCVAKSVASWTPPKRSAWPHAPARLIASPARTASMRDGIAYVQVDSRRVQCGTVSPSPTVPVLVSTPQAPKRPSSNDAAVDVVPLSRDASRL